MLLLVVILKPHVFLIQLSLVASYQNINIYLGILYKLEYYMSDYEMLLLVNFTCKIISFISCTIWKHIINMKFHYLFFCVSGGPVTRSTTTVRFRLFY